MITDILAKDLERLGENDFVRVSVIFKNTDRIEELLNHSDSPSYDQGGMLLRNLRRAVLEHQEPVARLLTSVKEGMATIQSRAYWISNSIDALLRVRDVRALLALDSVEDVVASVDRFIWSGEADIDYLDDNTTDQRGAEKWDWQFESIVELPEYEDSIWGGHVGVDAPEIPQTHDAIKAIGAEDLWRDSQPLTGRGVLIALLDSGVDYRHPNLVGNLWQLGARFPYFGQDFVPAGNQNLDSDANGHGTGCAGLLMGDGSCGGIATGVAPRSKLMIVRVGIGSEHFFATPMLHGIQFALQQRVHIISLSGGIRLDERRFAGRSTTWRRACKTVWAAGCMLVCAAGNYGRAVNRGRYQPPANIPVPGSCPPPYLNSKQRSFAHNGTPACVMTCGATNQNGYRRPSSGIGPCAWNVAPFNDFPLGMNGEKGLIKPDICAPGDYSRTTKRNGTCEDPYTTISDTSAATPVVAGSIALLMEACRRSHQPIYPRRIQKAIECTADPIMDHPLDGTGVRSKAHGFGAGRINVRKAYEYGAGNGLNWWD